MTEKIVHRHILQRAMSVPNSLSSLSRIRRGDDIVHQQRDLARNGAMWIEVFLFLLNFGKKATTRTKERLADGGGGGGVVALVSAEQVVWVGGHLGWRMETRAAKGLLGLWQQWWLPQEVW